MWVSVKVSSERILVLLCCQVRERASVDGSGAARHHRETSTLAPLAPRDPAPLLPRPGQLRLRSCSPCSPTDRGDSLNSGIVRSRKSAFRASSVVKEYI